MKSKKLLLSFLAVMIGSVVFATTATGNFSGKEKKSSGKTNYKSGSGINLNWSFLGPDNFGGRTKAVIIDSRDAEFKTIFAGSVGDGVYKSTTGGLTWHKASPNDIGMNVSCMIQAPDGNIYIGTGEPFQETSFTEMGGFMGHGIYKTLDGSSFTLLESTKPEANNINSSWAFVNKLAVSQSGRIYAAVNSGLMYSDDGGQSWTIAKAIVDGNATPLTANAYDVDVASDGTLSACVGNLVYISTSGDPNAFVCLSTKYNYSTDSIINPDMLPQYGVGRAEIAFAPSDPNVIYVVAVGDGTTGNITYGKLENIYVSKDKGTTWTVIGPGGSSNFVVFGDDNVGCNAISIVVYPTNPDKILVGGFNIWEGEKVSATGYYSWQLKNATAPFVYGLSFVNNNPNICYYGSSKGVVYSNNNFNSASILSKNYYTSQFYTVSCSGEGTVAGGAQGYGTINIPGDLNTTREGELIGAAQNTGGFTYLPLASSEAIIYSDTTNLIYRSDDMGGANYDFLPDDVVDLNSFYTKAAIWENFNYSNSVDTVVSIATQNYNVGDSILIQSNNLKFPFYITANSAINIGDTIRTKDLIASKMVFGISDATKGEIYYTRDALKFTITPTWTKITGTGFSNMIPKCFTFSHDGNYIYAGAKLTENDVEKNVLYVFNLSIDTDSTITYSATELPTNEGSVTSIAADPENSNSILVTLGGYGQTDHIYRCTNASDEQPILTSVQANLPIMPVYASLIEYSDNSRVIIGTNEGIWSCNDISAPSWEQDGNGMANVVVTSLVQQTTVRPWVKVPYIEGDDTIMITKPGTLNMGAIYASTFGQGLFECRSFVGIDEPGNTPATTNKLNVFPNPVNASYTTLTYTFKKTSDIQIKLMDLNGRTLKTMELKNQAAGSQSYTIDCAGLSNGTYILQVIAGKKVSSSKITVLK